MLARGSIGFQRLDDLRLALIERLLAGFPHVEIDQHFVVRGHAVALDFGIVQAGAIHGGAHRVVVGRVRELHVHQRSAAEINAPRDAMPEQHGKQSRNAENQRKGEKVPLLAQKIYVGIAKELHGFAYPLSIYDLAKIA